MRAQHSAGIEKFLFYELRFAGLVCPAGAWLGRVRRVFMTFEYIDMGRPGRLQVLPACGKNRISSPTI